jgi:uncharacterized phage protein (TIGR01671 family)
MREILFRGKRRRKREWVTGCLWHHTDVSASSLIYSDELDEKVWVSYKTVGQFTGMTDKNGKKIFEGDIVKSDDVVHNDEVQVRGEIFQVSMQKGCWVIIANDTAWDFLCSNTKTCEVIGNIHDNPELLEVAE